MSGKSRSIAVVMLIMSAWLATGCTTETAGAGTVTIRSLQSIESPLAPVTIELLLDAEGEEVKDAEVTPDPVVIWFESEIPISQIFWTVRCVNTERRGKSEVPCPKDVTVTVSPKKGCSKVLFGATRGAPGGEITIRSGHNAIASGLPDKDELERLFRWEKESRTHCDGTPKGKVPRVQMSRSVWDHMWIYEVVVRRDGEEIFRLDPSGWVEKDN